MADVSALDQWFLELINAIRLDPERELGSSLNAGLPAGTLSGGPLQPLAMNALLVASAQYHANWLLQNNASGTVGEQGSDPGDRMAVAGYDLTAPSSWAESVTRSDYAANTAFFMNALTQNFMSYLVSDPDARAILLDPDLSEVGIAQLVGAFTNQGVDGTAAIATLDYASNADARFVTGMVFSEPLPGWGRHSPVTGQGNVTIIGNDDDYTTSQTGGYAIRATSDHQVVTIGQFVVELSMGGGNVKLDLVNGNQIRSSSTITVQNGPYYVSLIGSANADIILDQMATTTMLTGNRGDNHLFGSFGSNRLDGGEGRDVLEGSLGDDFYLINDALETIIEHFEEGWDRVLASVNFTLRAGVHVEELRTNQDIFTDPISLTGNELSQTIYGNHGNNVLNGGGGIDTMRGSLGNDTYYVDVSGDMVLEGSGEGTDRVVSQTSFALGANSEIEFLVTSSSTLTTAINLTGNGFNQHLIGNAAGNVLTGGGGVDRLDGLAGNDTYYVDSLDDLVVEGANKGTADRIIASSSYAISAQAEIETMQTNDPSLSVAIHFTGNGFNQTITGNSAGNVLNGGGGNDTLRGLAGNDTYYVDSASDIVIDGAGSGTADRIISSSSYTLAAGAEIETMQTADAAGTTAINFTGNSFNQTLTGNSAGNVLTGGGGVDTLRGLGGSDTYYVDSSTDVVVDGAGSGTADRIITSASYTLTAVAEVETLQTNDANATTAINLTGNGFNQIISGNSGVNIINGGAGNDTLRGYGGADFFDFTTAFGATNVDRLLDFSSDDTIRLENAIYTALTGTGTLTANQFTSNTSGLATSATQRIIYESDTGNLYYDSNGNAAGGSVLIAQLNKGLAITNADFFII